MRSGGDGHLSAISRNRPSIHHAGIMQCSLRQYILCVSDGIIDQPSAMWFRDPHGAAHIIRMHACLLFAC